MNCNLVFGVFLQCILKCKFGLYAITMNLMLEWMVVLSLLRFKTKLMNICMWNAIFLLQYAYEIFCKTLNFIYTKHNCIATIIVLQFFVNNI
jgi:hypothetical protein